MIAAQCCALLRQGYASFELLQSSNLAAARTAGQLWPAFTSLTSLRQVHQPSQSHLAGSWRPTEQADRQQASPWTAVSCNGQLLSEAHRSAGVTRQLQVQLHKESQQHNQHAAPSAAVLRDRQLLLVLNKQAGAGKQSYIQLQLHDGSLNPTQHLPLHTGGNTWGCIYQNSQRSDGSSLRQQQWVSGPLHCRHRHAVSVWHTTPGSSMHSLGLHHSQLLARRFSGYASPNRMPQRGGRAQAAPGPQTIRPRVNQEIRVPLIRLVRDDGSHTVLPPQEALREAQASNLDLVSTGHQPGCQFMVHTLAETVQSNAEQVCQGAVVRTGLQANFGCDLAVFAPSVVDPLMLVTSANGCHICKVML